MTQQAKSKAIEHIVRRTGEAARQSIETQTRAMNEAARLAFMGQAEAHVRAPLVVAPATDRADRPAALRGLSKTQAAEVLASSQEREVGIQTRTVTDPQAPADGGRDSLDGRTVERSRGRRRSIVSQHAGVAAPAAAPSPFPLGLELAHLF